MLQSFLLGVVCIEDNKTPHDSAKPRQILRLNKPCCNWSFPASENKNKQKNQKPKALGDGLALLQIL